MYTHTRAVAIERQKIASRDALLQLESKLLTVCTPQSALYASRSTSTSASTSTSGPPTVMAPPPPTSSIRGIEARALGLEANILRIKAEVQELADMPQVT